MTLSIITPERTVFQGEADQVTIPTMDGEITILPHHVPLVGILKPGELLIKNGSDVLPMAVSGGVVHVQSTGVIILADTAERVEEIIEERAEEAHRRAKELLEEKKFDLQEYAAVASKIEKEMARLHVARKHKHRTHLGLAAEEKIDTID